MTPNDFLILKWVVIIGSALIIMGLIYYATRE